MNSCSIENSICWVRLTYPDFSQICFRTTLSPTILNSLGIVLEPNSLVRLDKKYLHGSDMIYKQYSLDNCKIEVIDSEQYTNKISELFKDFM